MINPKAIGIGMALGILGGLLIHTNNHYPGRVVYAQEDEAPRVIQIEVKIDWTEERIREEISKVFPDAPVMMDVARCESGFLQHAYNPTNESHDGGIFQISQKYHGDRMQALGLDPYDVQDNIQYARTLYDESGLRPWSASKHCWSK